MVKQDINALTSKGIKFYTSFGSTRSQLIHMLGDGTRELHEGLHQVINTIIISCIIFVTKVWTLHYVRLTCEGDDAYADAQDNF